MARRPTVLSAPDVRAQARAPERPLVIELAGVAGAGKSTIANALARLDPEIRARPRVSGPSYLASLPALVPTAVGLHWPFHGLLAKETKRALRLHALRRLVHRMTGRGAVLFDEGPVYMLARTLALGGRGITTPGFARWWRTTVAEWATVLDVVVWLEAPDDVLATRIHTRLQPHPLQNAHDRAVDVFLSAYRAAFGRVLAELCVPRGPRLWTFATDRASADQTARAVLARLRPLRETAPSVPEMAR